MAHWREYFAIRDPFWYAPEWARELDAKLVKIMATLDDVVAKVAALDTVEDSVVALLRDIKAKLDAAGADPAKLRQLSDALDAQSKKLSDAVVENTPAAGSP